jgi:hypothetical protein
MGPRGAIERLKRWLLPSSCGGWVLTALLLVLVLCAWAYSARDDLYKTYQGMQLGADQGPAFAASEKLELTKTAGGARVHNQAQRWPLDGPLHRAHGQRTKAQARLRQDTPGSGDEARQGDG